MDFVSLASLISFGFRILFSLVSLRILRGIKCVNFFNRCFFLSCLPWPKLCNWLPCQGGGASGSNYIYSSMADLHWKVVSSIQIYMWGLAQLRYNRWLLCMGWVSVFFYHKWGNSNKIQTYSLSSLKRKKKCHQACL